VTVRYLVGEVVHYGHRIDARDAGMADDVVRLVCEKKRFMGALYGRSEDLPIPLYVLGNEAWWVEDPVDCMTCIVLDARKVH
jgi:hypothetical protein